MRTINRDPYNVSSYNLNEKYFNINQFKGICSNKNYVGIDQQTFEDAENVYVNQDEQLSSRPKLKKLLVLADEENVKRVFNVEGLILYLVYNSLSDTYYLLIKFVDDGDFIKINVKSPNLNVVWIKDKYYVFEESELLAFQYNYDTDELISFTADETTYIPVTKVYNGLNIEEGQPSNVVGKYTYEKYNFDNSLYTDNYGLNNKDVILVIDGKQYPITWKNGMEYTITKGVDYYWGGINDYQVNNGKHIIVGSSRTWVYYSNDGIVFKKIQMPDIKYQSSQGQYTISYTISRDGSWLYCFVKTQIESSAGKFDCYIARCPWENLNFESWEIKKGTYRKAIQINSNGHKANIVNEFNISDFFVQMPQYNKGVLLADADAGIALFKVNANIISSSGQVLSPAAEGFLAISFKFTSTNTSFNDFIGYESYMNKYDRNLSFKYSSENNNCFVYATTSGICKAIFFTDTMSPRFNLDTSTTTPIPVYSIDLTDTINKATTTPIPVYPYNQNNIVCDCYANTFVIAATGFISNKTMYFTKVTCELSITTEITLPDILNPVENSAVSNRNIDLTSYDVVNTFANISSKFNGFVISNGIMFRNASIIPFAFPDDSSISDIYTYFDGDYFYKVEKNNSSINIYLPVKSFYALLRNDNLKYNSIVPKFYQTLQETILGDYNSLYPTLTIVNEFDNSIKPSDDETPEQKSNREFKELLTKKLLYVPLDEQILLSLRITSLEKLSSVQMGIFTESSVYLLSESYNKDRGFYDYFLLKSKLLLGNKNGNDTLNIYDGSSILLPTYEGLTSISYQQLVDSNDQIFTYLSEYIKDLYDEYFKNSIKLSQYKNWIFLYRNTDNVVYLYDLRNSSWWRWKLFGNPDKIFYDGHGVVVLIDEKLYEFDTFTELNKDDYFDNETYKISWKFKSQRLHFNAPNNYKHINSLSVIAPENYHLLKYKLKFINYRNLNDSEHVDAVEYELSKLTTVIKKVVFLKTNAFQFELTNEIENDNEEYYKQFVTPNISIKYRVTERIR